jgi:hypothetical protein
VIKGRAMDSEEQAQECAAHKRRSEASRGDSIQNHPIGSYWAPGAA